MRDTELISHQGTRKQTHSSSHTHHPLMLLLSEKCPDHAVSHLLSVCPTSEAGQCKFVMGNFKVLHTKESIYLYKYTMSMQIIAKSRKKMHKNNHI